MLGGGAASRRLTNARRVLVSPGMLNFRASNWRMGLSVELPVGLKLSSSWRKLESWRFLRFRRWR